MLATVQPGPTNVDRKYAFWNFIKYTASGQARLPLPTLNECEGRRIWKKEEIFYKCFYCVVVSWEYFFEEKQSSICQQVVYCTLIYTHLYWVSEGKLYKILRWNEIYIFSHFPCQGKYVKNVYSCRREVYFHEILYGDPKALNATFYIDKAKILNMVLNRKEMHDFYFL